MKLDRNTVLGFLILGALFIGYFVYTSKEQNANRKKNLEIAKQAREKFVRDSTYQDSIARVQNPKRDSLARAADSIARLNNAGVFQNATDTTERLFPLENDLIKVTFTSKGGQIKKVELKKFKGQDSNLVKLAGSGFDNISYTLNTGLVANSGSAPSSDFNFDKVDSSTNAADGSKKISFTLTGDSSSSITLNSF